MQLLPDRSILAIADDLTGALEVGSKFAAQGIPARVVPKTNAAADGTPISVIDTQTRHLSDSEAAAIVHAVGARMAKFEPWLLYKKTDSTLRGNIAAELRALLQAFPDRRVLYVPAYPAMGRIVKNGHLFVDGIPVHETAFATDLLNPIRGSAVRPVLEDVPAIIFDGESDEDILAAARCITLSQTPLIVAGPAAIASALAQVLLPSPRKLPHFPPKLRRCLIVNGSMHPTSKAQVAYALQRGILNGDWKLFEYPGKQAGVERALLLGESVKAFLRDNAVDALMVFGGDTAHGIHKALGAPEFLCCGEALPGVPVSKAAGLHWITKAGGFGKQNLIEEVQRTLSA